MAFKYREEIVGKRFLSVSSANNIKISKISEWEWRAGIIRAASHSDQKNTELNVLVEYDDLDWKKREWIKVYEEKLFKVFLIENTLVWASRSDPHSSGRKLNWPALVFSSLVDAVGLSDKKLKLVEFLGDNKIDFISKSSQITAFQNGDLEKQLSCKEYSEVKKAVKEWSEYQDGQRILLTTPSVLVGYRIEVYRSEGTTQWYTAVIISYNDNTKELTVTDDTVLEDHNEDPCLVQMKLIGDGVVESILRGENVGITPRRRSCTVQHQQNQHSHHQTRTRSGHHHHNTSTSHTANVVNAAANKALGPDLNSSNLNPKKTRQPSSRNTAANATTESTLRTADPVLTDIIKLQSRYRKRTSSENKDCVAVAKLSPKVVIEKCEQKPGLVTQNLKKLVKKSFEKNKKTVRKDKIEKDLPAHVTEHILSAIESVIQNYQPSLGYRENENLQSDCNLDNSETNVHLNEKEEDKLSDIVNNSLDKKVSSEQSYRKSASDSDNTECNILEENSDDSLVSPSSLSSSEHFPNVEDSSSCLITSSPPISENQLNCNGDCENITSIHTATIAKIQSNDMECELNGSNIVEQEIKPLSDDRQSDSGISEKLSSARSSEGSLRSSGDERSVSRSSESSRLSDNSDTAIPIPSSQVKPSFGVKTGQERPDCKNSVSPLVFDKSEPIKVWRDPDLLNSSSQTIRHITSVQHNSMQHPSTNSQSSANTVGYPALGGHHSAPPPGAAVRLTSPHQHSRPGTAPLPVTAPPTSSTSQQLPFHSAMGSLPAQTPHHVQQSQFATYGHPIMPHSHQTAAAALMMSQYGNIHPSAVDILAQQKFSPGAPWSIQQMRDQELFLGRERVMAAEWERAEREKKEKLNREKLEKDRKEAEIEKQQHEERERAKREVQQHFEESLLRLANQKKSSPGMPTSWNSHNLPQSAKTMSAFPHSNGPKDIASVKGEPMSSDVSSRYSISAMDARYKQELLRKQEEEKLYLNQKQEEIIRHKQAVDKSNVEMSQASCFRPTVTTSSSGSTPIAKAQASYSLYGYQPFQHSYITQDTAHRALVTDSSKTQGSITAGKPVERPMASLDYKHNIADRTISPKAKSASKPVGAFKPYEQCPLPTTKPPASGLLRIAEPHNLNKGIENWHSQQVSVDKTSPKSKSSHHSLVQQGLVPNPMYTRVTPGSPRPAHSTPDHRLGQSAPSSYIPGPSPAHMSNSSHQRSSGGAHPQTTVINENHYKPLPQSGHVASNAMHLSHPSVSSLPQGQPLDLQSAASKRKSQEIAEDFSMKKVKQEPVVTNSIATVVTNSPPSVPSNTIGAQPTSRMPEQQQKIVMPESAAPTKENSVLTPSKESVPPRETQPPLSTSTAVTNNTSTVSTVVKMEDTSSSATTSVSTTTSSVSSSGTNSNPITKLKKAWLQRHSGEDSGATFTIKTEPALAVSSDASVSSNNSSSSVVSCSLPKKVIKSHIKDTKSTAMVNGHVSDGSTTSSDADQDANASKRKGSKSKPRKGSKKPKTLNEELSDSEKNFIDAKQFPVTASINEQPKKRGRRPKGKMIEEKKKPSKPEKSIFSVTKSSPDSFLQNGSCCEVAAKLSKCRECRMTPHQRNKNLPNIFCRFYAFRKLKQGKNSTVSIAGFSEPGQASQDDLKLWLPRIANPPTDLDIETSKFLLAHVGDQFCDLVEQEREALSIHMCEDKTVTWKRVVQGVREMCDVCETTLFNIHWVCHKCGFVVCIDCYKARKNGTIKEEECPPKDRDGYQWLFCNNKHPHDQSKLMLTQIIAGNALWEIGKLVHDVRKKFKIPAHCRCCHKESDNDKKPVNGINKKLMKSVSKTLSPEKPTTVNGRKLNGVSNKDVSNYNSDTSSPLSWLADVALTSSGQLQDDKENKETIFDYPSNDSSDKTDQDSKSDDNDENFSTLRELLIRPHPGPKASISNKGSVARKAVTSATTLDDVINCVIEQNIKKVDDGSDPNKGDMPLVHFTRRYPQFRNGREPLPIRVCSLAESTEKYPNLPHSWLCGGRLLRLHNPFHEDNMSLFQEQWKRGQPVVVSDVTKQLDMNLWYPHCFSRDFGDVKVDLINCRKGTVIPNQPLHKFWDGFDSFAKRLKDEDTGEPSMLKLKDWPPGEDFSEILPTRFNDLMKALPLPMYTHRDGVHNLASRLPECFVKPDLGPKMYNAYGLAKYPETGTTNLHLDISDAVNVMVYVGIPQDGDDEDHIEKALQVIDGAGCDALTRQRIRDEKPGALWHIYNSRDADKIRDLLNKVAIERGETPEPHHDPIHDQSWYLDKELRNRLYKEYGVEGYTIVQCLGDCIFIPAGAPHQVQNLHSCIKVAEDFVSPENISHCFTLTQEFRYLSDTHTNHEDKLQIKNIIYHAIKDGLAVLLGS